MFFAYTILFGRIGIFFEDFMARKRLPNCQDHSLAAKEDMIDNSSSEVQQVKYHRIFFEFFKI